MSVNSLASDQTGARRWRSQRLGLGMDLQFDWRLDEHAYVLGEDSAGRQAGEG